MAFDHFRNCNGSNPHGADASRARSARNASRVSWWMSDLSGAASILMAQAETTEDRTGVEALSNRAIEAGPEFLSYRTRSAFTAVLNWGSTATPMRGSSAPSRRSSGGPIATAARGRDKAYPEGIDDTIVQLIDASL